MSNLQHIMAAILAGGTGTRLRSVVADRPKVLAQVGEKPFLAHLLDQLVAQGLSTVVLCTGYLGDQVEAFFGESYLGIHLSYSREDQPLGTGGAIIQALPMLQSETLLVLNGDSYCRTDLQVSLAWHRQKQARGTLVLAQVAQVGRYGQVQTDAEGRIEKFCEKGGAEGSGWINSGIYWFERAALAKFTAGQSLSLERDVLAAWVGQGLYGFAQKGPFLDIGIPEDYARAEHFFSNLHELNSATSV
jgi:NDP-sugar pyrophosphorylase family protein